MAMKFRRSEAWHPLWLLSLFASLATIAGLASMMIPSMASSRGLAQRLSETAIFAWIGLVAGHLSLMRDARQTSTGMETS